MGRATYRAVNEFNTLLSNYNGAFFGHRGNKIILFCYCEQIGTFSMYGSINPHWKNFIDTGHNKI